MGPTNVALVKLFKADQQLREAQGRLEAVSRNVRIQERRVNDLAERLNVAEAGLKEHQARAGALDLDLKSRDSHIEKIRTQQQNAKNNKEYQAFLIEINTEKVDRNKVEDELLREMEAVEKEQGRIGELSGLAGAEGERLTTLKEEIGEKVRQLQGQVDALQPARDQAAAATPPRALEAFERLAERHEGEAMASIGKPDRRREEYICGGCHMSLVADVYNRLHVRDDLVFCPSCQRILYIPEDLPPDQAVNKPRERKEPKKPKSAAAPAAAATGRQVSAADVHRSVTVEEEGESGPADSPVSPPSQGESGQ